MIDTPGRNPEDPALREPPGGVSISVGFLESIWNFITGKKSSSLDRPIANFDSQLSAIAVKENPMPDTTPSINLSKEVIAKASFYLNDVSVNDAAPWLDQLMADGGNPAHWTSGEAYCISAASACWGFVMKKYGITWPFQAVPGTQLFYDNANAAGFLVKVPNPGDIVIYKDGNSAQGHAEIVVSIDEVNLHTIGFNTSSNAAGNMRAGNGCFMKSRSLTAFHGPRNVGMWIRGYVAMSKLTAPEAQPGPYSA